MQKGAGFLSAARFKAGPYFMFFPRAIYHKKTPIKIELNESPHSLFSLTAGQLLTNIAFIFT